MIDYTALEDNDLVRHLASCVEIEARYKDYRQRIEFEINNRLAASNARQMIGDTHIVKLAPATPSYDVGRLRRELGENVDRAMWDSAYTAEHPETETVPAKFHLVKLNSLAKMHGKPVQDAMDLARLPDAPGKLKLEEKE